jgi:hypothetical protein
VDIAHCCAALGEPAISSINPGPELLSRYENTVHYSMMHGWMHGCMDAWMHGCMDASSLAEGQCESLKNKGFRKIPPDFQGRPMQ